MKKFPRFLNLMNKALAFTWASALLLPQIQAEAAALTAKEKGQVQGYWFDGAEISRYALTQSRYGEEHKGSAELVFVTEPFLTKKQVKHEFGPGPSTPVLKLNALRSFNTGIYSYRTMSSIFTPIAIDEWPHSLKVTNSVQDWCGHVFQQINRENDAWSVKLFSYFQGEGDASLTLEDAWLEDELWTRLRLSPKSLPQGTVKMVPGNLYLRFQHKPHAVHEAIATLSLKKKTDSTYTVHYPALKRKLTLYFKSTFPYVITGWKEEQGNSKAVTEAKLTHRIEHSYYWSQNKPSDSPLRKKLGLPEH